MLRENLCLVILPNVEETVVVVTEEKFFLDSLFTLAYISSVYIYYIYMFFLGKKNSIAMT
jgi:hypothetical protein